MEKDVTEKPDQVEEKKENVIKPVKVKRIGRITFGVTLIIFGISIILLNFVSIDILRYLLMLWPVVFISLGIETLYYSRKDNAKFDGLSIFLVCMILFFGMIFSAISFGINKVLYQGNLDTYVTSDHLNTARTYTIDGKLTISNLTSKKININVIEDKTYEETVIRTKLNVKKDEKLSLVSLMTEKYAYSNVMVLDHQGYGEYDVDTTHDNTSYLTIQDFPEWLESVDINIITKDKGNIIIHENA